MDDGIRVFPSNEVPDVGSSSTPERSTSSPPEDRTAPAFECNICFDTAREPVVTQCGHLFCWECVYQWLEHTEADPAVEGPTCPVCKAGVSRENIIPVYSRDGGSDDPRKRETPQRPAGHRPDVEPNAFHRNPFGFQSGGGVQFSAGFGGIGGTGLGFGFPFLQFQAGNAMPQPPRVDPNDPEAVRRMRQQQQSQYFRFFIVVMAFLVFSILLP